MLSLEILVLGTYKPTGMTVFRLGSFEFRHASDDDVGQTARASMRATDVLINIVDVTATEAGATSPSSDLCRSL